MAGKGGSSVTPHHDRHKVMRLGAAAVVGVLVAVVIPAPDDSGIVTRILVGFIVAALGFTLPLAYRMLHADPEQTRAYVEGLDPGRSTIDSIVFIGSLGSLAGVGYMLLSKGTTPTERVVEGLVAVGTVASGWILVHTMFALRYARHWFNAEPGCVDFNSDDPDFAPSYSDFLYLALAIGSSFAVSDTNVKTTRLRRITIRHSLLSYLFGTVIVAATINLLAGLAA